MSGLLENRQTLGTPSVEDPEQRLSLVGTGTSTLQASIAHELYTPMPTILGYCEWLLQSTTRDGSDIEYVEQMHSVACELSSLLDVVIEHAKFEPGEDLDAISRGDRFYHDLATPLQVVGGYAELLLEDTESDQSAEREPALNAILDAIHRMTRAATEVKRILVSGTCPSTLEISETGSVLIEQAARTFDALESKTVGQLGEPRILVIEDDANCRRLLGNRLRHMGCIVDLAGDGLEGMRALAACSYDLILLDILMPKLNGYQVLAALKSEDSLKDIPVIVISALGEVSSAVRCLELGADDYMSKTFDPMLLRARLGACLESKRMHDREQRYLAEIELEREKSDRLLLNVLPRSVAERLKASENIIADSYDEVTVLFCDLVGFTEYAGQANPAEVVRRLDEYFVAFDKLVETHGVEKVKTIGDAYMLAGGLPEERRDHAEAVANVALEMLSEAQGLNEQHKTALNLRIGIHSGPVVAGVIGRGKFCYDLWGGYRQRSQSHGVSRSPWSDSGLPRHATTTSDAICDGGTRSDPHQGERSDANILHNWSSIRR